MGNSLKNEFSLYITKLLIQIYTEYIAITNPDKLSASTLFQLKERDPLGESERGK